MVKNHLMKVLPLCDQSRNNGTYITYDLIKLYYINVVIFFFKLAIGKPIFLLIYVYKTFRSALL